MKTSYRKMTSLLLTALVCVASAGSLTACGGSGGGSRKKEDAIHNFYKQLTAKDLEKTFSYVAPTQYWDYLVDCTGLPKEKIYCKLFRVQDVAAVEAFIDSQSKLAEYAKMDIKITSEREQGEKVYSAFNKAMDAAGIEDTIEELYYIEFGEDDWTEGYMYKLGNSWYFGQEFILEPAIKMANSN